MPPLAGCVQRRRPNHELPNSFRFVQESVANTLGWPLHPAPRVDNWRRMLSGGGTANGAIKFAKLALDWLAVLSRSLDVVLISEHYDESLLLLSRRLSVSRWSSSTSRRNGARSVYAPWRCSHDLARTGGTGGYVRHSFAERERVAGRFLLRDPEGPWLWPNELDTTLRTNWLDSLSYLYFNASLWTQLDTLWPGEAGRAQMAHELQRFRETRKAIVASCDACESIGAQACLAAARVGPCGASTPMLEPAARHAQLERALLPTDGSSLRRSGRGGDLRRYYHGERRTGRGWTGFGRAPNGKRPLVALSADACGHISVFAP